MGTTKLGTTKLGTVPLKIPDGDGKTIHYDYNELNELKRENNEVINSTIVYTYDAGGNIQTKSVYPYTTAENPGTPTLTIPYEYTDANWKDKLTSYNGKTISYDAIGNPTAYDGWTFTWEAGRQLASMVKGTTNLSFKYNDEGIRTEKNVNGAITKYYLNGDKVTLEDNGTDKIYYTYDSTGDLVSMNLNGVEYFYIRNAQGDIIGLFDGMGTQVVTYSYDSWGKLINIKDQKGNDITNTTTHVGYKNPYRYKGYRYDSETGLYYLQSRYYNPDWGRFINADALGGKVGTLLSHNVFVYAMNNPVNISDPSGFIPTWAKWAIGVVAATVAVAVAIIALPVDVVAVAGTAIATAGVAVMSRVGPAAQNVIQKATQAVSRTSRATKLERDSLDIIWSAQRAGKGNTGIGSGTFSEAWNAGRSWVGTNPNSIHNKSGDIIGLSSENGLRAFRIGYKPSWGQYQANFQQNIKNERTAQIIQLFNAHLTIIDK